MMHWVLLVVALVSGSWQIHTEAYRTKAECEAHATTKTTATVALCTPYRRLR